MSSIEKMTIQGIRSYGPKDQDTQVIEFFFPVTLIVGQNGCGKTTVIECLKFATTSDMPPNTKGNAFVFDPKLIDEVETKGRIKLYFRDTSGLSVQVQKNLCCTQKAKKLEFRTAETIISRYGKDNKLLSTITSKCINADAEVVNAFGVSKAVLEHVIFCHQEDSNWPLSEGKVLKTRFDEIFAATKYIKALDVLRKIRLEKAQLVKHKEIEKKFLEANKNRSDALNRDLAECTQRHENFVAKRESLLDQLKPIQKQIEKYFMQSSKIVEIRGHLDKIENEKLLLEKQIKELLLLTKHCLFTGSDQELKQHVNEYTSKTDKMRDEEQNTAMNDIEELNFELKELTKKKSMLIVEVGALENQRKTYEENRHKLMGLLEKTSIQINVPFQNETDEHLDMFMLEFTNYLQTYITETASIEKANKTEEQQIQSQLEAERDAKSKVDQNIETKTELIEKNRNQMAQIQRDLNVIADESVTDKITKEIATCDAELESKLMDLTDVDSVKKELTSLESQRSQLRKTEQALEIKLNKLHENSKVQTELDLLGRDVVNKEDQIRKLRLNIDEELVSFFEDDDQLIEEIGEDFRLKHLFDERMRQVQAELSALEVKFKEVEKRQTSNDMKRKMMQDDLRAKETQLREFEDQLMTELNDVISSPDDIERFDSILEQLQEEHKANMDEKGFLNGVDKTYKRFINLLQDKAKSKSRSVSKCTACPVCSRDFKDDQEVDETVKELTNYTQKLPKKMKAIDEKIAETETKLHGLIRMKPTKENYDRIRDVELVELRGQIETIDRTVSPKIKKEMHETEERMKAKRKIKSLADTMQTEIVVIDKCASEIKQLKKKICEQRALLGDEESPDTNNLEDTKLKKQLVQQNLNDQNKRIEQLQLEITRNYASQDKINSLKENLNVLKQRKNELQSKSQKKTQLSEKIEELLLDIDQATCDIKQLKKKLNTHVESIKSLSGLKEETLNTHRQVVSGRSKLLNQLQNTKTNIADLMESIRSYENINADKLSNVKQQLREIDREEKTLQSQIEIIRARLDEIKLELARQEIKQRELNDNLLLRSKRVEHGLKKEAFEAKKQELEVIDVNFNLKTFQTEKRCAEERQSELNKELSDLQTKMSLLEGKISTINEELESDNYKGAYEKWSVCAIDLRVLEVSVVDIEKYYKALDRAVMNYHMIKMNEINKSIRQLWRQVYRGNDIDYIEIRSEEDNGEDVQIKARRTYNYRVVIIKGDCALDMRGRCSAGQKVLASIIIRLALAEVFCLNSGILALDEPTTNLDRENIESLSSALVDIIKTRSKQKNFQLIIITHDEDFLEMLGRSEFMDSFYRVKKDENGFSKISRRSNADLS